MKDLVEVLAGWRAEGKRVALARVIDTEGSAPRGPGASMAVADDGAITGSVSGGCVEGAVVHEAHEVLRTGERKIVTFGYSDAEGLSVGLTCGGTLKIFVEPLDW